ncbi:MAG: hypothetical protein E7632_13145, partial [Ruminococcaceae bacterium]|nr:hypothetical protein [Oscillospiraceae bacterium]
MKTIPPLPQLSRAVVYSMAPHTIIDFLEIPRPISSLAVCDAGEAHYTSPDGDFILYPGDLLLSHRMRFI